MNLYTRGIGLGAPRRERIVMNEPKRRLPGRLIAGLKMVGILTAYFVISVLILLAILAARSTP